MDLVICILPKLEPHAPSVGPAILKSHCIAAGFACKVIDFNIELYTSSSPEVQDVWGINDKVFDNEKDWTAIYEQSFKSSFEQLADRLVAEHSTWIGLSVFSYKSKFPAIDLIKLIKARNPAQKIVVGGAGIYSDVDSLKNAGADHWIVGDAETSIVELLKGNMSFVGIDNTHPYQVDNLDSVLMPDYDDIDFGLYNNHDDQRVYITASRGCIRDCTFCDVASMWPKFRYRSSSKIVEEIIHIRQRYNVSSFYFTDSLVNGGVKIFRDMCHALAQYRETTGDNEWTLGSQFICRSSAQMPPSDYDLMKAAGFSWVAIGVESASQAVRDHMRKGFTNEDMWYTFEQLRRVKIELNLLLMAGYVTETKADFDETLELLQWLSTNGYLEYITTVSVFDASIFKGTPLYNISKQLGVLDIDEEDWYLPDNTNNFRVRVVRLLKAYKVLEQHNGKDKLYWIAESLMNHCKSVYKKMTGTELPDDILNYDESLEYYRSHSSVD
jgi:radical SAM superfamily enzyme YgiQ (UPF0313 family)